MSVRQRHVLAGDLESLEYAMAEYVARWGAHFDGITAGQIAGIPTAVANMAMTVIRKNLLATWEEAPPPNDTGVVPVTALGCDQCDYVARTLREVTEHSCPLHGWYDASLPVDGDS